jgi:CheY-like chemotaxis protein
MQPPSPVVLVVEDELLIRMAAVDQLERQGFTMLEAASGQEALDRIALGDRVDVVFTDVNMPGDVDGLMLAREVNQLWPGVGIIVTSGKAVIDPQDLPAGCRFYPKPYKSETIHAAIRALLA